MNPRRRLNHAQCHQTIVAADFFPKNAKMPPSFVRIAVLQSLKAASKAFLSRRFCAIDCLCLISTFCRINGNFSVIDWVKIERSQKSDGTQSFPTNIIKSKFSHHTIESKLAIFWNFGESFTLSSALQTSILLTCQQGQSRIFFGFKSFYLKIELKILFLLTCINKHLKRK